MDRLPEELLALICEHCEHASLKTCRLVNSRFHEASTCHVFEHLYLGLFEFSLIKMKEISRSPSLAKFVKKITMYSDIVPSWTKESWQAAIDFRPAFSLYLANSRKSQVREEVDSSILLRSSLYSGDPRRDYDALPRHNFTTAELEAGWQNYQTIIREQAQWRQDAHGLIFKEAFSQFPNLGSASVQCATPFSGRCNTWPLWSPLLPKIYVGPDDFLWRQPIDEPDYAHQTGQAALLLLEAIGHRSSYASTKNQITTLHIHSSHLDPYLSLMSPPTSPKMHAQRYQSLLSAFEHLTTLSLHVPHATISAHLSGAGVAVETAEFLRTARQLRSLDLRYGDDEMSPDDDGGSDNQLQGLFDSSSSDDEEEGLPLWPKLETLSLATNIPASILLPFLAKHASTLHSLELKDMLIHNVDHALSQIPKLLPRLTHVYMECLWDDAFHSPPSTTSAGMDVNYLCILSRGTDFPAEYEESVKGYLLGKREELPVLERDGGSGEVREWAEWTNEAEETIQGGGV